MTTTTTTTTPGAKRIRSPNYPAISLTDALERLARMYPKVHTHKVDRATMAQAAGYAGINGAALSVLSALKKYGLIEEIGDDLRVTERAVTLIADPIDSPSRKEAIQAAAFAPTLFAEIRAQLPGSVPDDLVVRSYLLKKSFAIANVDIVIRAFRETMKLVTDQGLGYSGPVEEDHFDEDFEAAVNDSQESGQTERAGALAGTAGLSFGASGTLAARKPTLMATEVGAYPVGKNCMVRLLATGPLTQKAVEALIKQLQIGVDLGLYPEDGQEAG